MTVEFASGKLCKSLLQVVKTAAWRSVGFQGCDEKTSLPSLQFLVFETRRRSEGLTSPAYACIMRRCPTSCARSTRRQSLQREGGGRKDRKNDGDAERHHWVSGSTMSCGGQPPLSIEAAYSKHIHPGRAGASRGSQNLWRARTSLSQSPR